MAHFSPALNLDTDVPGEIEFFKRLKNDPSTENWWVLHSYYLSDHIKQKEGEIDFNAKTELGRTGLHSSCRWGYLAVVKCLVEES